jgi:hypothetical protein
MPADDGHNEPSRVCGTVSVQRVFAWLKTLKYTLKMAPRRPPPHHTVVKPMKDLGTFVQGITPDMIERIVSYIDADGNGEVDIGELDTAFRLSRWELDEVMPGERCGVSCGVEGAETRLSDDVTLILLAAV